MTEYQNERQENERRINRMRLARALYEAIGGAWCKPDPVHPSVQRLAQILNYSPEQLCTDVKDLYSFVTDQSDAAIILGRITARRNAEAEQNRRRGDLDFIPEPMTAGDVLGQIIADYCMRHCPELLHDEE